MMRVYPEWLTAKTNAFFPLREGEPVPPLDFVTSAWFHYLLIDTGATPGTWRRGDPNPTPVVECLDELLMAGYLRDYSITPKTHGGIGSVAIAPVLACCWEALNEIRRVSESAVYHGIRVGSWPTWGKDDAGQPVVLFSGIQPVL